MPIIGRNGGYNTLMRVLASRYSIVASICVVFLFLGAMVCIQTCHLSSCVEVRGHVSTDSGSWKLWINQIITPDVPKKPLTAYLVVLIISSAGNMERRDAIRQTWLKEVQNDVLHLFSIGSGTLEVDEKMTLESENARFQDILFLPNVNDSYGALTEKLLWSLVWVHENVEFKFLLKADDDTFARVDDIINELFSIQDTKRLYWGFFDGRAHVRRKGRWAEIGWVLCDRYLPYALGGGYVLSEDLVRFVAVNKDYLQLYKSEDVSLGTWLAPVALRRIHDSRFDTEYKSRGCSNGYLVTHKQSAGQMKEKFWLLQERNQLCAVEQRDRNSYEYNWKVPPSQCCQRGNSTSR